MDAKFPGDLVYILGTTENELGGSEYYDFFGYIGLNVPQVYPDRFLPLYRALSKAIRSGMVASAHGIYRGGLGIHLAMSAMGGNLGMVIDLDKVPAINVDRDDVLLFSETAGRFVVTVDPTVREKFEAVFDGLACACVGQTDDTERFRIRGRNQRPLIDVPVGDMKTAWKEPFKDLI
jgi:phosphoribosylformylglycinamidine synthase